MTTARPLGMIIGAKVNKDQLFDILSTLVSY